jgi:hypothetical protein
MSLSVNKNILIILIFLGILCIAIELSRVENEDKKEKVIYRYIPRTFEEDQENPIYVSDIFDKMFNQPSPWVTSVNEIDRKKQKEVNRYFVSQV